MKLVRLISLLFVGATLAACMEAPVTASRHSAAPFDVQLPLTKEQVVLQQQRIALLSEVVKTHQARVELGLMSFIDTVPDAAALIKLKLTAADSVEAKRVLFEELAQLYEQLLKMQQAQVEVGILEPNEYRRSKVQLLEIQLLQLQLSP